MPVYVHALIFLAALVKSDSWVLRTQHGLPAVYIGNVTMTWKEYH